MIDPTQVAILRRKFIDLVQEIRAEFENANIPNFKIELSATGRTFGGDAKITFEVGTDTWGSGVKSPDLGAAVAEVLRREGFIKANDPLALPAPGGREEPEEML